MSIEELSKDIYKKTGYQIEPNQIKSYLSGDIEPFPGTINILSKYAQVSTDFWLIYNTEDTLKEEKESYRKKLIKSAHEQFSNEYIKFSILPDEIRKFVIDKENQQYLKAIMDAKKKGISSTTLSSLIKTIANEIESFK